MANHKDMDKRWERLPLWAQVEMATTLRHNDRLQEVLDQQESLEEGTSTGTNTRVYAYMMGRDTPLPNNARIRFTLPSEFTTERYLDAQIKDDLVILHGSEALVIRAEASNVASIEPRRL